MTEFRFPWSFTTSDISIIDKKYDKFDSVLSSTVKGIHRLSGRQKISSKTLYRVVNSTDEITDGFKNICISDVEFIWDFNELTSSCRLDNGQRYIEIELSNKNGEVDIADLFVGLSYLYGVQFSAHTMDDGRYIVTTDINVDDAVFDEISSKMKVLKKEFAFKSIKVLSARATKETVKQVDW